MFTTVKINKESKKVSHVLKERIQREHRRTDASSNIYDLDYSEIELFNVDIGTKEKTEITGGVLKLEVGESSGTWVSSDYSPNDGRTFDKVRVDLIGDNLPGTTIEVSYDGGVHYQTVSRGDLLTLGIGTLIIIKLTLTTGTQIDSLVVQYSMTT